MRRPAVPSAVLLAVAALAGCGDSSPHGGTHHVGDTSFVSSAPRGAGPTGISDGSGRPGAQAPAAGADAGGGAAARSVEESDLYARSGTTLLVQNAWRGLLLVGLADPAQPRILSRVPLSGTPVGLYLRGTTALVIARDHIDWAIRDDGPGARPSSRLWTVDVSDPAHPVVTAELAIAGQVQDSRLVGDVLYVFTGGWSWWWVAAGGPTPMDGATAGVAADAGPWSPGDWKVASIDVSELSSPKPVAEIMFPSDVWGFDLHANVTSERVTLSRVTWDASGATTRLAAVDISDPGGALVLGAQIDVSGQVQDRWSMDLDTASGTFRAIASDGWNLGATLHVLAWATPGEAKPLSSLHVDVAEQLTAASFDGTRGYLVTSRRMDPLWVLDLADPAAPSVSGDLTMPGQLDFVLPRGDRLLALGHTNEAGKPFQLHVSLVDVSDPSRPALLARRTFGPDWAFVPAGTDDLHKAFQVVDDLVLVPFEGWDQIAQTWLGGTQLLTLSGDVLTLEGFVSNSGSIQRALALAPGLLAAFSDVRLQTIDATDRANPLEIASIDLARPVNAIAVAGAAAVELSGEPWQGGAEVVVVPAADPDAAVPTARFPAGSSWGKLYRRGSVVWALVSDWMTGTSTLTAYDVTDPASPAKRGVLALPASGWWSVDAVQAGDALAAMRSSWTCGATTCEQEAELQVIDLSRPDSPSIVATVELPSQAWVGALRAVGTDVWYSQYAWAGDWAVRYYVGRVGLADPSHPALVAPVNVPGTFFSASDDGKTIYTEEVSWPVVTSVSQAENPTTWLHALSFPSPGTARLETSIELPGLFYGTVREGDHAYTAGADWAWSTGATQGLLASVGLRGMSLDDLSKVETSWPQVLRATSGKLFVSQGWPAPGVLVYGLFDPAHPSFEQAVATSGWSYDVVVEGGRAYLPAGPYGVVVIDLSP